MSLELVGKEILPNVYIKNITVSDYSDDHETCTIDICVLDYLSDSGKWSWSNEEMLVEYMDILATLSPNNSFDIELRNGSVNYDQKQIAQYSENLQTQKKRLSAGKTFIRGRLKYFDHKFKFIYSKGANKLSFHVAAVIDSKVLSHNYALDLFSDKVSTYVGPISSEYILFDGKIKYYSEDILKSNGEQNAGPVRFQGKVYMAGSLATSGPQDILTKRGVFIYKI